jgi:hypothetical protein
MTARRRTLERAAAQERVIAALLATGDLHFADRLQAEATALDMIGVNRVPVAVEPMPIVF